MSEEHIKIGQILKTFRQKKKYTQEKISDKTKISIQNIENIEEGNFDLIGGKFYQKSFIRLYAKALRISERKILAIFDGEANGIDQNERYYYSADMTVRKQLGVDSELGLETAVDVAAWTHNTNVNFLGYCPLTLVTGKSVVLLGVSIGDLTNRINV